MPDTARVLFVATERTSASLRGFSHHSERYRNSLARLLRRCLGELRTADTHISGLIGSHPLRPLGGGAQLLPSRRVIRREQIGGVILDPEFNEGLVTAAPSHSFGHWQLDPLDRNGLANLESSNPDSGGRAARAKWISKSPFGPDLQG